MSWHLGGSVWTPDYCSCREKKGGIPVWEAKREKRGSLCLVVAPGRRIENSDHCLGHERRGESVNWYLSGTIEL